MKRKNLSMVMMAVLFMTATSCASSSQNTRAVVPGPIMELPTDGNPASPPDEEEPELPPELKRLFPKSKSEPKARKNSGAALFWEAYFLIRTYGYSPYIEDEKLFENAIRAIARIDRWSHYKNPEEAEASAAQYAGKVHGIGVRFADPTNKKVLRVRKVLPNSPAEKAGMKPGDLIIGVDGESVSDLGLYESVAKIRGEQGTPVKLKMSRKGWGKSKVITVIRDEVKFNMVESKLIERDDRSLAYIKIELFTVSAVDELRAAIIHAKTVWKVDSVIIDLRNNPGGMIDSAIEITSAWTGTKQPVFLEKNRRGQTRLIFSRISHDLTGTLSEMPTVVLVNKNSASASEILAGALQDHKKATIIGEKTFGKGRIQRVIPLSNGGNLILTSNLWLTPNGHPIDEKGITPDIIIESTATTSKDPDNQLEKAVETLLKGLEFNDLLNDTLK